MEQNKESNQKAFTTMAAGLLNQKKKARRSPHSLVCAFRGHDGTKCAMGFLIPDDRYSPSLENQSLYENSDLASIILPAYPGVNVDMLNDVMGIHDNSSPETWQNNLTEIAAKYSLEMPTLS